MLRGSGGFSRLGMLKVKSSPDAARSKDVVQQRFRTDLPCLSVRPQGQREASRPAGQQRVRQGKLMSWRKEFTGLQDLIKYFLSRSSLIARRFETELITLLGVRTIDGHSCASDLDAGAIGILIRDTCPLVTTDSNIRWLPEADPAYAI